MAFVFEDDEKQAAASTAGGGGGRYVFEDDEPAGPVIRQGKAPSLIDRVFDLFENPDKERAKAVQALVDAEVFNIRPSDAMRYRDAIDSGVKLNKNAVAASRRTTLLDRVEQSWQTGVNQVVMGSYGADVVLNNDPKALEKMLEVQRRMPTEETEFIPESKLEYAFRSAAKMSPMMFHIMKESGKKGLPVSMAAGGAVALLNMGPQGVSAPVTVPAAAAIGFKAGATGAAFTEAMKLEAGLAFAEFAAMKDADGNKMDINIARAAAFGVGAVNAGLEVAQVKMLLKTIPGSEKILKNAIMEAVASKVLKDRLASVATMYAGTVAKETAQELAQESTNIVMEHVAANVNNALKGTDIKASDMAAVLDRLFETGKESAAAFSIMALPGSLARALPTGKRESTPDAAGSPSLTGQDTIKAEASPADKTSQGPFILGVNEDTEGGVTSFTMADPATGETFDVPAVKTEDRDRVRYTPDMSQAPNAAPDIDAQIETELTRIIEGDDDIDQLSAKIFQDDIQEMGFVEEVFTEDDAKPETVLERVKAINDSIGEKGSIDLEPLVNLGRSIMAEGHQTLEAFTARAKELLSDVWDKVKYHIQAAWSILNNERGSVNIGDVTKDKGTGNIPAKDKPQAEAVIIDSLNPTGKIFSEYTPQERATMKLGDNMTTLDKTMGKSADEAITIYRGATTGQKEIVPGDFITTNKQLAKDYAGTGTVIEKKVKLSDILDDKTEPLGEEYIYRPKTTPQAESGNDYTHRPSRPENGSPLDDLTNSFSEDIYSKNALEYFGEGNPYDKQSINIIKSLRGKPDADVKIYRAVDKGVKSFNEGDWVTINKNYAKDHGEGVLDGKYDIIEKTVKAKDLIGNGDSIHEFGYFPAKTTPQAEAGNPFKDSVVQELVYHGTKSKPFDKFNTEGGAFFTTDRTGAISYTQNRQSQMSGNKSPQGKARVIAAYVDVRKPLDLTAYGSEEPILSPVSSYLGHQKNHAEKLRILLGNPSDNQILTAMKGMVINDKLLENLYHNDPMIYVLQEIFNARQAKYFGNNANAQSFLSAYKYKVKNGQEIFQERIDSDVKKLLEGLGYDSVIFNDTAVGGLGNQKSIKSIAVFNSDQIHQLPNPSRPPEVGGQSTLYSGVDPTQIIPVLKSLTNNIQEAMPHLEALGLKAYESGKSTYSAWSAEMKSYLGDLWESFKGIMATLWESVKTLWESVKAFNESLGERGSVSWKKKPTTEEINMMLSAAARQDQATGGNLAPESYLDLQAQAAQEAFAVIEKKMTRTQKREAAMLARQGEADARLMPVYSAMSHIVNAGGMSLKSLQADYDGNTIRELMNKRPGLVSNKGTMGPDVFADQHGFESGDDMINAILDWRGLKAEGKAQAKEFLKYYEKVIATDDMAAMREEFERAEQKALDRLTKKYKPRAAKGLKTFIRQKTGQERPKDRLVTEYDALAEAFRKEARTAREAFRAGKKGEVEKSKEKMRWLMRRRKSLQNVRDYFNLTDAEMMSATNRRNPALMDDAEFKQFLRNVELKAVELAETRQEKMALLKLIEDKRLKKVDNYRRALELPTFNDMTAQQLRDFAKLLEPFQDDDIFLTQRELETVDRTDLKGIKTWREARERLAKEAGVPVEELNKVHVEALDSFRWDTSLRERDPFFGILVEQMTQSYLGAQLRAHEIENRVYELARKSEKSRDRGIIDRLIPQDDLIMAYLEAPMDQKAAIVEQMTPEQIDFANYMQQYFAGALEYLIATKSLERGRENYFVHIRKTFLENLKDGGLKKAVSEIFKTYQQDQMVFNILDDDTGKILPLEKFFQFSLQRTDTMDPTRNVTKAFLTYVNTFERKKMFDAIIPKLDIYAQALTPTRYTPRGLEIDRSLKTFVNKWINNKKGRRISFDSTLRQGGPLDVGIRALRAFTTILDLGLSPVVQTAAFIGEQVTNAAMLGNKAMAIGTARMRTAQGKAILKKYEAWVGRSLWEEFTVPGKEITERLSHALFAGFHLSSVSANKQFLLASLTEQEWATGEISTERLAEMRLDMGRFRVVPGTGSLVGSTSAGDAAMQYKKWAAPFARTLYVDAQKFLGDLKSKPIGEALTSREARELYRLAYLSMAVFVVGAMAGADDDDKSVMGKAKARMYREAMTLMQGVDPTLWLASPRLLTWLYQTASALKSVALMETYKSGDKEGELKGDDKLKRQFVPGVVRSVSKEENKR